MDLKKKNALFITFILLSCVSSSPKEPDAIIPIEDTGFENNSGTEENDDSDDTNIDLEDTTNGDCELSLGQEMDDSLTEHFINWLTTQGYNSAKMTRADITGGSFGGLISASDCITKEPVIFIHGNSDQALYGIFGGWEQSRDYFLSQGYRSAELYATTYGLPALQLSSDYTHDKESILQVRQFIEAVLEYTDSDKVDIIAHSLGVTITRRAILGGTEYNLDGSAYNIGAPLTDKIDSFLGIAGGNQGLTNCAYTGTTTPICHEDLGLYPGWWSGFEVVNRSTILNTLNDDARYEADFIYSMWAQYDTILGLDCLVWGVNSCQIPAQDGEYSSAILDHLQLKTDTAAVQYSMVVEHIVP